MVFFGNTSTANGSVAIANNNSISINLEKIPLYIKKVCVCYAIYKSKFEQNKTFALANNLRFDIYSGDFLIFKVNVSDVQKFSTVVLVEFYRHNGSWKIYPVVNGYRGNLPQLCQHFGIDADY
jgi:tellurium resistance protein TerD